jgi:hypothetical protein
MSSRRERPTYYELPLYAVVAYGYTDWGSASFWIVPGTIREET